MAHPVKIFLDTNFLFDNVGDVCDLINGNLVEIKQFLDENKISQADIVIPEIVFRERTEQVRELLLKKVNNQNDFLQSLKKLGITVEKKITVSKTESAIKRSFQKIVRENQVKVLKTPPLDLRLIIDRAIKKKKPFSPNGRGFKDTVIWLSLVEEAKKVKFKDFDFVLVSNDGDFDPEVMRQEFVKASARFANSASRKIHFIKGLTELKVFLDNTYKLQLELKKTFSEIKLKIRDIKHSTEINEYINEDLKKARIFSDGYSYISSRIYSFRLGNEKNRETISYIVKDISFMDISEKEKTDDVFNLLLDVSAIPVKAEEETQSYITSYLTPYNSYVASERFLVTAEYNKASDELKVLSASVIIQASE